MPGLMLLKYKHISTLYLVKSYFDNQQTDGSYISVFLFYHLIDTSVLTNTAGAPVSGTATRCYTSRIRTCFPREACPKLAICSTTLDVLETDHTEEWEDLKHRQNINIISCNWLSTLITTIYLFLISLSDIFWPVNSSRNCCDMHIYSVTRNNLDNTYIPQT